MKLTTGEWNNEKLAIWFNNIAEGTFRNTKPKKLEILRYYADFYTAKGKVYITEIYCEEYCGGVPTLKDIAEYHLMHFPQGRIFTPQDEASKLVVNLGLDAKEESMRTAFQEQKTELWGKTGKTKGSMGDCSWVICKVFPNDYTRVPVPLNQRELQEYAKFRQESMGEINQQEEDLLASYMDRETSNEEVELFYKTKIKKLSQAVYKSYYNYAEILNVNLTPQDIEWVEIAKGHMTSTGEVEIDRD